tara:strand:- start:526 stop:732 length:207 start_codon:yes stop_codon:yes gene_type:complete
MTPDPLDKKGANALMEAFLTEEDPEVLRETIMKLVMTTGFWYRRAQTHKMVHPFFFLAGFIIAYLLGR